MEGVEGDGIGESLTVEFLENVTVKGFLLFPGYTKSLKTLIENVIPTEIRIVMEGKPLRDYEIFYSETADDDLDCFPGDPINLNPRFIIFDTPIVGKLFELQIVGVLPMRRAKFVKYSDLAISEWSFILDENEFKPRRTDYEKILSLLSDFAEGDLSNHFASDDIIVEELLLARVGNHGFFDDDIDTSLAALQDKKYHDHLISQLKARGGSPTDPWLQIFLKAEHSDFINNTVMAFSGDNKHYLMGATCFEFDIGGTVWIHPIIVLNQKYKIIELRTEKYSSFPDSIDECVTFSPWR